jgi:hypothetical protein
MRVWTARIIGCQLLYPVGGLAVQAHFLKGFYKAVKGFGPDIGIPVKIYGRFKPLEGCVIIVLLVIKRADQKVLFG